jgi:hypothetical protein
MDKTKSDAATVHCNDLDRSMKFWVHRICDARGFTSVHAHVCLMTKCYYDLTIYSILENDSS